ncbi:aminodeoxychorismate lyase [Homoserinibacter gongjuensis]|uniref:4-amino-4-deoxychorismate lyase n=1 Tax=Homoserinibacter gongjuensis TaxID=1162968 RepID=A0ABQ6JYS2_9MICO|nr:aminodeoxychorismate lyase [Homoserinibacter gongjuensis]GMA92269.1 4-amino-4-deoxychorismate lyase [Homoserinibacter gongjuensis]
MSIVAIIEFDEAGVATGSRLGDAATPVLRVDDLGPTRGDGVFETASLVHGNVQALEAHLARFVQSAAMLELPRPDVEIWRDAVRAVAASLTSQGVTSGSIKFVLTRGVEGSGVPTGWVLGTASPDFTRERTDGIRVVLLDRGYRHDVPQTAPWLLAGAKTLSYAVNRAAQREAARRGADDVLFVSSDGYLLEGPTSSLLLRLGSRLVTPRVDLGILAGTTQADLFTWAESAGYATGYELLTPDDLESADAAWLVSSVRHVAPVRSVDGRHRAVDGELTGRLNAALDARTS